MNEAGREIVLRGVAASAGLALGRIAIQRTGHGGSGRTPGTPAQERESLQAAMTAAGAQLETLAEAAGDRVAADILEFQIALLDDEDLIGPIFDRVAGGEPADAAWLEALNAEIAVYGASGDRVLEARSADLADLRDRVLDALSPGSPRAVGANGEQAIYVAEELTPSRFLETDWTRFRGAAIKGGSAAGHVALLARARGTPLVIGLGPAFETLRDGTVAILDAERGHLVLNPSPTTLGDAQRRLAERAARAATNARFLDRPAITAAGERVEVLINVDDPALLAALDPRHTDGIGLTRTEFLFRGPDLPDEARQFQVYAEVLEWAAGRPVIIRTLDAGGDKPIAGLTPDGESNPFLGLRGLRLSLARPEIFTVQLRALARAAVGGNLKVMAPMVSTPAEFEAFRGLFREVVDALHAEGIEAALPPLGMMVEVPAAALCASNFDADFMSIGSNDLVQYVMAAGRDIGAVADLYDPGNPAVLELIERVVESGERRGIEISLCGDMASDPNFVPRLLELGLRRLSVAPATLGAVKATIAGWDRTGRRQR
jgi:phosphoenolpyruvate-protein phosphotransferase (PTS system enzyme I)